MTKVIEFYVRDLFPKKVKWLPRDQRGKVIEFPKEESALANKDNQIRDSMKPASQLSLGPDVSEQRCRCKLLGCRAS